MPEILTIYEELLALAEEYKKDGSILERYNKKILELNAVGEPTPMGSFMFIDDLITALKAACANRRTPDSTHTQADTLPVEPLPETLP